MHTGLPDLYPLYAVPVLVALLLGTLFPVARHITDRRLRRQYLLIQLITFASAILGAKLVYLLGEHRWPFETMDNWRQALYSGRSIVGALIFGLLGAELAKPLMGYRLPPNDRFAALLPFALATGRTGCLLQGCCRGVPFDGAWAITYADGIARHPSQIYEMLFHVAAGIGAVLLVRNRLMIGRVFSLYLICYGAFRLGSEFLRETPKTFGPFSAYQWLSIVMILLGAGFLIKRSLVPSTGWADHPSDASTTPAE